jgi:hypothetical protein
VIFQTYEGERVIIPLNREAILTVTQVVVSMARELEELIAA